MEFKQAAKKKAEKASFLQIIKLTNRTHFHKLIFGNK